MSYDREYWKERLPFIQAYVEGKKVTYNGKGLDTLNFTPNIDNYSIEEDTMEPTPFNLERALAGDPVQMRCGAKIAQVLYVDKVKEERKVLAVNEGGEVFWCYDNGRTYKAIEHNYALVMAPKKVKHTRKVALYENGGVTVVNQDYDDEECKKYIPAAIEFRTLTWEVEE